MSEDERPDLPQLKEGERIKLGSLESRAAEIRSRDDSAHRQVADMETQALSSTSMAQRDTHDAGWRQVTGRKVERAVEGAVPVNDEDVRARLRQLGQPVTLFGEGKYERRLRLRKYIADGVISGQALPSAITKSITPEEVREKKRFFTEGSEALKEARLEISAFSLLRAKQRVARQKAEYAEQVAKSRAVRDRERKDVMAGVKQFVNVSSQVGGDRPLSSIKVSPDGELVLVGSWDHGVRIFDLATCNKHPDYPPAYTGHVDRVTGVAWHPGARTTQDESELSFVSVGSDKAVKLWNMKDRNSFSTLGGHSDKINKVAFHPTGNYVATTSCDKTWRLWDVTKGREAYCVLEQEGHSRAVYGIDIQSDGGLVATTDISGVGRVWDLRHGRAVFTLEGHVKQVLAVSFSPNGWLLCTGGDDNVIKLWDLRRKQVLSTIAAHSSLVSCVAFEPDHGRYIASASYDTTISFWDTTSFELVKTLQGHENKVMGLSISPDASSVVSCSFDRTWKLWQKRESFKPKGIDALNLLCDTSRAEVQEEDEDENDVDMEEVEDAAEKPAPAKGESMDEDDDDVLEELQD